MKKLFLIIFLFSCGAQKNTSIVDRDIQEAGGDSLLELRSQMLRLQNSETKPISYIIGESKKENKLKLPQNYLEIPSEEVYESKVILQDNEFSVSCGDINNETLKDRINDCSTKYQDNKLTYWKAYAKGISGEGNWTLVASNPETKTQIWKDDTTGLLWTSIIETGDFEKAAKDPKRTCENFKLLAKNPFNLDQAAWRLPTRSDFLQADINGARFVLPDRDNIFWSASQIDKDSAWSINQKTGILSKSSIKSELSIRCIGVPLK